MEKIEVFGLFSQNLDNYVKGSLSLRLEEYFKLKAKSNQVRTEENRVLQKSAEQKIDTRAELAKIAGVSHDTIYKVKEIKSQTPAEILSELETREFESRNDVCIWMIQNQFGRRNLDNYVKGSLSLRLEEYFKEKAKENKVKAAEIMNSKIGNSTFLQKSAETFENKEVKKIDTRAELAKIAGVSHDTIYKVKEIKSQTPAEILSELETREFESRNDVCIWMIQNQFGRRNLDNYVKGSLSLRLEEYIEKQVAERKSNAIAESNRLRALKNVNDSIPQISAELELKPRKRGLETRDAVAKMAGVSHDTVNKVKEIKSQTPAEILSELARRNINLITRKYLTGRRYKEEKKAHGGWDRINSPRASNLPLGKEKTAEKIAAQVGMSHQGVKDAEKFAEACLVLLVSMVLFRKLHSKSFKDEDWTFCPVLVSMVLFRKLHSNLCSSS